MKKLIRKSVHETNSSSSHSISLAGEDKQFVLDTIYPDQFGRIFVYGGEYGWEWERYNDAVTKLSYAYQDNVPTDLLERVVKGQTGATEVIFDEKSLANGYIDHDSYATAADICQDEESTKNFIFNKNSWLFTGNDNGTPDPTFYQVPVFQDGKMVMPIYKYELVIDGMKKTTKFLKNPTKEELNEGIQSLMQGVLMSAEGHILEDTQTDIYFQLSRPRNFYEMSYHIRQDYSKGYIIMMLEGVGFYELEKRLEESGKNSKDYKAMSYDERNKIITKEALKDTNLTKKLNFTVKEI